MLANVSDSDLEFFTSSLISGPAHGTLALIRDGTFTYTPAADFHGVDTFTYKVKDDTGLESNVATVTINVNALNDAPMAENDGYTTAEDTTLTTTAATGVLANDADVDTDHGLLTAELVQGPQHDAALPMFRSWDLTKTESITSLHGCNWPPRPFARFSKLCG